MNDSNIRTLDPPHRFPVVTLVMAAAVGALHFLPPAQRALQYDRSATGLAWIYRLLTCHATHWSAGHLGWDVGAFLLLGALCERANRTRFLTCLLIAAAVITLSLHLLQPRLGLYRGLSGIDSALFTLLALSLLCDNPSKSGRLLTAGIVLALLAFVAKLAFEWLTGRALFVAATADGFTPVPLSHLAGAATGATLALAWPAAQSRVRRHRNRRYSKVAGIPSRWDVQDEHVDASIRIPRQR